jgi:probable H4MPT-linked C1 transfer pathway protein
MSSQSNSEAFSDTSSDIVGWDVGGANLKVARLDAAGKVLAVEQFSCELWRGMERLEQAVESAVGKLNLPNNRAARHVITMTGELADIFASRHEGVVEISSAMQRLLPNTSQQFFAGASGLIAAAQVPQHTAQIASANWLASAQFIARQLPQAILVDMGSTTTDIVVVQNGKPQAQGLTDAARLTTGELVYSGLIRTPVMAVVQRVPFNGQMQRIAAEHFATMADVYRLTGKLATEHDMSDTADGSGKSPQESARRLARMVGRDIDDAPLLAWQALAHFIASAQLQDISAAVQTLAASLAADTPIVGAGVGRQIVRQVAHKSGRPYVDFADLVQGDASDWAAVCAPAYSVAWLAGQTT